PGCFSVAVPRCPFRLPWVPGQIAAAFNGLLNLGVSFPSPFDIPLPPMYSGAIDLALLLSWRSSARRLPHPPTPRRPVEEPKLRPSLRTPGGYPAWGSLLF